MAVVVLSLSLSLWQSAGQWAREAEVADSASVTRLVRVPLMLLSSQHADVVFTSSFRHCGVAAVVQVAAGLGGLRAPAVGEPSLSRCPC